MRKGILLLLVGAAAIAIAAGGCGGGDDGESTVTETSISKPEYLTKAELVCVNGDKRIEVDYGVFIGEADEQEPGSGNIKVDYDKFVDQVVKPNLEREIDELRELGAPKGDAAEVEAMLDAREESIDIAEEDPEAVIQNSDKVFAKASKAADAYGLKLCATR